MDALFIHPIHLLGLIPVAMALMAAILSVRAFGDDAPSSRSRRWALKLLVAYVVSCLVYASCAALYFPPPEGADLWVVRMTAASMVSLIPSVLFAIGLADLLRIRFERRLPVPADV
jgi:uncharacterized membrane protein